MTGAIRRSDGAQGLFALLALIVLLIQLVAPSGFMPVRTVSGVVVTLCTGNGAVDVIVARGDTPDGDENRSDTLGQNQPCVYAAAAQSMPPPLGLADVPLPSWILSSGLIGWAVRTGVIAQLAAPPPPSLGPPAAV